MLEFVPVVGLLCQVYKLEVGCLCHSILVFLVRDINNHEENDGEYEQSYECDTHDYSCSAGGHYHRRNTCKNRGRSLRCTQLCNVNLAVA